MWLFPIGLFYFLFIYFWTFLSMTFLVDFPRVEAFSVQACRDLDSSNNKFFALRITYHLFIIFTFFTDALRSLPGRFIL